jgi:uncharacterized membrane protein
MGSRVHLGRRFLRARIIYRRLAGSYWFRPFIFIILAIFAARFALFIDQLVYDLGYTQTDWWWIYWANPLESARTGLTNTASILLGLFGVLLSISLIPLTIATSTYGNVILTSFLRDKGTQNVIGYFAFVIFFDVTAAISLPHTITLDNYPGMTVTISLVFLMGALITTIYLFHHIATLLQATYITRSLTDEVMKEIETSFVEGEVEYDEERLKSFDAKKQEISEEGTIIRSTGQGYVAGLNYQYIFNKAVKTDATVLILKVPGDYVAKNEPLAKFFAQGRTIPKLYKRQLNSAYTLGVSRTVVQDIDYGVQLLAIIASKALSPAVNDPITATICIDKIGEVLSKVVSMPTQSQYVTDDRGNLRLIAYPDDFGSLMATGFNQIRQYGNKAFEVMCHQLYAIETIAYAAKRQSDREIIKLHADLILEDALNNLTSAWSKEQVKAAYHSAITVIDRVEDQLIDPGQGISLTGGQ